MSLQSLRTLLAVVFAGLLMLGCAGKGKQDTEAYSGYLQDYSKLEQTKDARGIPVLRYVSPKIQTGNYTKIIVEPMQYYPEPQPTADVSSKTLEQIKIYIDQKMKTEIGKVFEVVDQPGEGTLRFRVALTAVGKRAEGVQPYQAIPVALVLTGARAAAGHHPQQAELYLEAETQDSLTGERLGIAIRSGKGERLVKLEEGHDVTLNAVKPLLDKWLEAYVDFLTGKR